MSDKKQIIKELLPEDYYEFNCDYCRKPMLRKEVVHHRGWRFHEDCKKEWFEKYGRWL